MRIIGANLAHHQPIRFRACQERSIVLFIEHTSRNFADGPCVLFAMLEAAIWCLTLVLILVGFAGVIVPLLPGTTLILAGVVIHKLLLPASLPWLVVGFVAVFWLLSIVADLGGVILGTRWFGGSKWGMAGASGGAFVGIFFSLPALILGTIFGAMAAEKLLAKKTNRDALKAGAGAATGFVISTAARLACAGVMIGLFLVATIYTARGS